MLDEAHLSKPFDKLLKSIHGEFGKRFMSGCGARPLRVIRMSATSEVDEKANVFRLDTDPESPTYDLWSKKDEDGYEENPIKTRFEANKYLTITPDVDPKKLNGTMASAAIELARDQTLRGKRIVVFVRKPEDAKAIAKAIREHVIESVDESGSKPKKVKTNPYDKSVEVLTGTMRGLERDELVEKPILKRFLDGDEKPGDDAPVFLISTSAGEVGFDLNADHMVCDATTIESFIQRLGRVNRRGEGEAVVQLFAETPKKKDGKLVELKGLDKAIADTVALLKGVIDLSPKNIAHLKQNTWAVIPQEERTKDKPKSLYELACSPEPATVELTDILLDAWSMTSITERMPGRPDVAPWLRGIDTEQAQTSIAWRAELDLDGFADLNRGDVAEWFSTHRVLTYETLSVKTSDAATWFLARWKAINENSQRTIGDHPVVIDRAGIELLALREVIRRLESKSSDKDAFLRGAEIVVPASFGGIERGKGLLNAAAPEVPKDEEKKPLDEQKTAREQRNRAPDVADVRRRYREVVTKTEAGDTDRRPLTPGSKPAKFAQSTLKLETNDDKTVKLVSYVPKNEKLDTGQKPQSLEGHVADVRKRADTIIAALKLPETDPIRLALELAADWHDHGKNREFFQRTVDGKHFTGQRPWPEHVRGKSDGKDFGKAPRGYRHEFGSLREFAESYAHELDADTFDLAMHLIATHHGRGRPHFPKGGFDPDAEDRSDDIHTEAIRRFARMQRKYGWWGLAWLENLLRCADAMASADPETDIDEPEADTSEGGTV